MTTSSGRQYALMRLLRGLAAAANESDSVDQALGWLERSPSYKELKENLTDRDLSLFGFLGYPVLMTADIILYKATRVPVGADQVSHLELCREIVRKFNGHYGEVFPEPRPLLTEAAKVVGTDPKTDLAVLKVEGTQFPYVQLAAGAPLEYQKHQRGEQQCGTTTEAAAHLAAPSASRLTCSTSR